MRPKSASERGRDGETGPARGPGRPRLLFVSRPFEGLEEVAGEQVFARSMAEALRPHFRVRCVARTGVEPNLRLASVAFYDWANVLRLAAVNLFRRYPVVLFNSPFQAPLAALFRLGGSRTAVTVYDLFFVDNGLRSAFDRYSAAVYRMVALGAGHVLVPAAETQRAFESRYRRPCRVLHLFPSAGFRDVSRPAILARRVSLNAGYVGAYEYDRKRVGCILDLLAGNTRVPLTFHLAGPVTREFVDRLNRVDAPQSSFRILGLLTEGEKVDFYRRIRFLYFPSRLEGVGLPLIEAFAAGVLPIVHRDARIPEVVKGHCEVVDGPAAAVERIAHFHARPHEYAARLVRNHEHARRFTPARTVAFLKALAEGRRPEAEPGFEPDAGGPASGPHSAPA